MLEVNNVNLTIKKEPILFDISLSFSPGKIYGLVGHNGSGKTMLMKCMCGFVKPTSGVVLSDNKIVGKDIDYIKNVGIIIETPNFIPYYSGFKNLKILASIRKKISDEDIRNTMKMCGLDPKLKRHVKKYSLGMRQRLGIAQAIMEDPEVLILDEPMNGLDRDGVEEIRKILLQMKDSNKTIILASHNKEDIDVLCDEVYYMEHGRIVSNPS